MKEGTDPQFHKPVSAMSITNQINDQPLPAPANQADRAVGLDALRGLAILAMALSGLIPQGGLPNWMYHAQVPPPDHVFDPSIPGLTWVDLVFPFFLFSMGVSIPLALTRRIERGAGTPSITQHVIKRGLLLGFFAVYIQHIKPYTLSQSPKTQTWFIALLGLALLFPIYMRLPKTFSSSLRIAVRSIGWIAVVILLLLLKYPDSEHSSFWIGRRDIIIVVLANVSVSGALVWLFTRHAIEFRVLVMMGLIGLRLAHDSGGWVQHVWNWSPLPSMYTLYFHQYLLIVLPGTIIGDLLHKHMQEKPELSSRPKTWPTWQVAAITFICLGMTAGVCAGLQARWLPGTSYAAIAVSLATYLLWQRRVDRWSQCTHTIFGWGVAWLILGLLLESYEGGIKKDHPTLSYYFVTTGLGIFTLVALGTCISHFDSRRLWGLAIANGQNPLLAYAGISNLLAPLVALSGLGMLLANNPDTPWLGFVGACIKTLLLALIVAMLTRRRVIWRT
ncbi:MAG: DUF5009 domain-containing protein [Phycisphaerales bacterium]|nr:DUF5009 domain-containing protein [Phycisphaerales bacterium]